jgi:hypothetical protein
LLKNKAVEQKIKVSFQTVYFCCLFLHFLNNSVFGKNAFSRNPESVSKNTFNKSCLTSLSVRSSKIFGKTLFIQKLSRICVFGFLFHLTVRSSDSRWKVGLGQTVIPHLVTNVKKSILDRTVRFKTESYQLRPN